MIHRPPFLLPSVKRLLCLALDILLLGRVVDVAIFDHISRLPCYIFPVAALVALCRKYGVKRLVHYEVFEHIPNAIHREKRLKKWPRRWKINLIEAGNPQWNDLYETLNC